MFLTPKFDRKTLALTLISAVLALTSCGIVFITYFFYTQSHSLYSVKTFPVVTISSSVNRNSDFNGFRPTTAKHNRESVSGHTEDDNKTQQIDNKQNGLQSSSEQIFENNIRSRSYVLTKARESKYAEHLRHYDKQHTDDAGHFSESEDLPPGREHQLHADMSANQKQDSSHNAYSNSEMIYIDDYDRLMESTASKGDQLPNSALGTASSARRVTSSAKKSSADRKKLRAASEKNGRLRGRARNSNRRKSETFYYGRKNILITAAPNTRRPDERSRYSLVDDDENYISNELLDNDSIGSGSGDFLDEDDREEGDADDSSETEVYVAVSSDHPGMYQIRKSQRQPTYQLNSGEFAGTTNYTGAISFASREFSPNRTLQSMVSPTKKWIPPSIVSGRESHAASVSSPTSSTTTHPLQLSTSSGILNIVMPPGNQETDSGAFMSSSVNQQQKDQYDFHQNSGAWLETRARRIMGNVKKSEERSRQLLLCAEAGGGELCRMLFKGHLNE